VQEKLLRRTIIIRVRSQVFRIKERDYRKEMGRSVLILYTKMSEVFVFLDDKNRMKENKSPEFPTRTTYKFDHAYFTDMNNM